MEEIKPHKRRVRYSGTHPKNFHEKYKEHNPEKYQDTIEKVIRKGSTPAGMHISICVQEILKVLHIQPGEIGADCTLGYGGHTRRMLECLGGQGHVYGFDVDPFEIVKTTQRLAEAGFSDEIFTPVQTNFANIRDVALKHGPFDFILADLGVSSMQIDNPERGFTFKYDGPLDLRLNPKEGCSAADRLNSIHKDELCGMLLENADEVYAEEISREIINLRKKGQRITTTFELRDVISKALAFLPEKEQKEAIKKSCTRTFQALRIDVNNEFEVLESLLSALPDSMAAGGRVAILTFHSGEDRIVKRMFKEGYKSGVYSEIAKDVIRPGNEECARNPRARSAKLRWAVRSE